MLFRMPDLRCNRGTSMWKHPKSSWMCEPEDKIYGQNIFQTVCQRLLAAHLDQSFPSSDDMPK